MPSRPDPAVWHVSQPNSTPLLMPKLECIAPSIHLLFGQILGSRLSSLSQTPQQSYAEFDSVTSFLYPQITGDKWHSMTIHGRFVSPKFTQSWKVFSFKRTLLVGKKTSEQTAFEAFPLDTPFTFVLMNLRHVGSQLLTFQHDQFQPFGSVD